jgi:DNA-binding MarR family transcriptional regulator
MVQFFKARFIMNEEKEGHTFCDLKLIANSIEKLVCDIKYLNKQLPEPTSELLTSLERAKRHYHYRRKREAVFENPKLFGEPAWDMLVDLFIAGEEGNSISVTSLCIASGAPETTALRWIVVLEQEKLIIRNPDPNDQRRVFLSLTDTAKNHMRTLFELS